MTARCCVCDLPGTQSLGGRDFCDTHYQHATHERKGVWRTGYFAIIGVVAFVAVAYALINVVKPTFTPLQLILAGSVIAIVPAVLWMIFFYLQDRLEPEPRSFVIRVFLLGALVAAAIGIPVVENLFDVRNWIYLNPATSILGAILVVGFTQEFLKYAAVRWSVYDSPEFDERADGVIYGTAAGLGYATVLNIRFIVESGGVALAPGVLLAAETALAQAAFGGVMGYFLGRAKLESEPLWWMPLGITIAAVLNGLFSFARSQVTRGGLSLAGGASVNFFNGFALAALVAVAATGIVSWLVHRQIETMLADTREA